MMTRSFGSRSCGVELLDLADRDQLVELAVDQYLRLVALLERREIVAIDGRTDAEQQLRPADRRRRRSTRPRIRTRTPPPITGAPGYRFAMKSSAARKSSISPGPASWWPALRPTPAKVETQHGDADARQSPSTPDTRPSYASSRRGADGDVRTQPPRVARLPADRAAPRAARPGR